MNCHRFEREAADWLSGRLSPDRAAVMDAHRAACPACAQIAQMEEALREGWRVGLSSAPADNLWPRLARRLEAPRCVRPQVFRRRTQWAVAGFFIAALALGIGHGIGRLENRAGSGAKASPPLVREAELQSHAAAWSELSAAAPEDPAVDDPVGANMETLWTSLKTDGK